MAKKEANAKAKGGGGGLIGFLLATILALAVGAGFGFFLDGHLKGTKKAEPPPVAEKKPEAGKPAPVVSPSAKLITLVPVVTNLAEPKDAWIRVEASMLVEGEVIGMDILGARLAEDFVAYLRTVTLSQFEGASGFQNLRDDLVDRAAIRDKERIKDVIIHSVVIE